MLGDKGEVEEDRAGSASPVTRRVTLPQQRARPGRAVRQTSTLLCLTPASCIVDVEWRTFNAVVDRVHRLGRAIIYCTIGYWRLRLALEPFNVFPLGLGLAPWLMTLESCLRCSLYTLTADIISACAELREARGREARATARALPSRSPSVSLRALPYFRAKREIHALGGLRMCRCACRGARIQPRWRCRAGC